MLYLDLANLAWLAGLTALACLWWWWHGAREAVYCATQRHCRELNLQLLDQTLVFRRLRFAKLDGRRRLVRDYRFEFSTTGDERYLGEVRLIGNRQLRFNLPPYREPEVPPPSVHCPPRSGCCK